MPSFVVQAGAPRARRSAFRVIASTKVGHSSFGQVVAHPGDRDQLGAGDRVRRGAPAARGASGSASPWITTAGTSSSLNAAVRNRRPAWPPAVARSRPGRGRGRTSRPPARAPAPRPARYAGEPIILNTRAKYSMYASRSFGARRISTPHTRSFGVPTKRSPVVDIIEASEARAPAASIAICWAIIPPIEVPTTWARSMPRWSSRPKASAAMSVRRYGTFVGQAGHQPHRRSAPAPRPWWTAPHRDCRTGSRRSHAPRTARTARYPSGSAASRAP